MIKPVKSNFHCRKKTKTEINKKNQLEKTKVMWIFFMFLFVFFFTAKLDKLIFLKLMAGDGDWDGEEI